MDVYLLHLSLSSVILIDSSTQSPVHVLMLTIHAVRTPGTVPCIIYSMLALTVSNSSLFTPALLRTALPHNIEIVL